MAGVRMDAINPENEDFIVPAQSRPVASCRDALGKDSGKRVRASNRETMERALATKQGRR